ALFIGHIDHPVDKAAQEHALADLQDLERPRRGRSMRDLDLGQRGARENLHRAILSSSLGDFDSPRASNSPMRPGASAPASNRVEARLSTCGAKAASRAVAST